MDMLDSFLFTYLVEIWKNIYFKKFHYFYNLKKSNKEKYYFKILNYFFQRKKKNPKAN